MNLTEVTDLTSIGTLFAFVLVCGGVLLLNEQSPNVERRFRTPYINSRYIAPILLAAVWLGLFIFNPEAISNFFSFTDPADPTLPPWEVTKHKIPLFVYIIFSFVIVYLCFRRRLSLIPVLGLVSCGYLMTELGITNWIRFLLWLGAGLIVYFLYGYRHSKLGKQDTLAD